MKISAIQSNYATNLYSAQRGKINNIQKNQPLQRMNPTATISFAGKNSNHVVFVGAELPPYCKVGGVATVMNDYTSFNCENKAMVIPYYNGKIEYDENGKPTEKVSVHRFPKGHPLANQPFYTKEDLSKKTLQEIIDTKEYVVLEEVGSAKNMTWSKSNKNQIQVFHVKDTGVKNEQGVVTKPDTYMIFTDATARMPKPYADDSYSSRFGGTNKCGSWEGTAYAKFDKAVVELMPVIEEYQKGFDPGTVICSDSHTAYIPLYMTQAQANDDKYYQTMKSSFVGHNLGSVYCGETTNENMLVNCGLTADQIKTISNDPEYIKAIKQGAFQTEQYLKQFLDAKMFDDNGKANPILLLLNLREQNLLSAVTTVSEGYSDNLGDSPIRTKWDALKATNKVGGILNPLNAKDITGFKPMSNKWLNTPYDVKLKDGSTVSIKPFANFDEEKIKAGDIEHLKEIKRQNKINLIERLSLFDQIAEAGEKEELKSPDGKTVSAKELENGLMSGNTKNVGIYGKIDKAYLDKLKNGEDVTLFVTWGRGDFQKGIDTTMQAFETYITKYQDKNAILLLGGDLPAEGEERIRLKTEINKAVDGSLKGRVVYMDGFVPANGFASAADAAVFPSRFAPCELTDLESKKFFATPIVTNCQGLAQKNFDPNNESEKERADAFKTKHSYLLKEDDIETCGIKEIQDKFKAKKDALIAKEKRTLDCRNSFADTPISNEKIKELALLNAKSTDEYKKLARDTKDEIVQYELAEKFNEFVVTRNTNKDLMQKILINQANLDTTWAGNAALHPGVEGADKQVINKSSEQLYKEQHLDTEVKNAKELGAGLFTGLIVGLAEKLKAMKESQKIVASGTSDATLKSCLASFRDDLNKEFGEIKKNIIKIEKNGGNGSTKLGKYIAASAAIVAGAVGTGLYIKNKNPKQENEIEGETFIINV